MAKNEISASERALRRLAVGNKAYMEGAANQGNVSRGRMAELARNGQTPYAVVVTCSDSRVPPEHIFSVGIGDLFVVRTAGNVVGDFERGSIEYAVEQLGVPLVVIMGHSQCGAVDAALAGSASGYLDTVVSEIQRGIADATSEREAIRFNIDHSLYRVMQSDVVRSLAEAEQLTVVGAEYDLPTGQVSFLPEEHSL